jgi:hypothetical protein
MLKKDKISRVRVPLTVSRINAHSLLLHVGFNPAEEKNLQRYGQARRLTGCGFTILLVLTLN